PKVVTLDRGARDTLLATEVAHIEGALDLVVESLHVDTGLSRGRSLSSGRASVRIPNLIDVLRPILALETARLGYDQARFRASAFPTHSSQTVLLVGNPNKVGNLVA